MFDFIVSMTSDCIHSVSIVLWFKFFPEIVSPTIHLE